MNSDTLIVVIVEILVAAQALWFVKKHPAGWRRVGAFMAMTVSVISAGVDVARLLGVTFPDMHTLEEIGLYITIWILLQVGMKLYIDRDDAINILYIFDNAKHQMDVKVKKLSDSHGC